MKGGRLGGFAMDLLFPPRCPICDVVLGFVPCCEECRRQLPSLCRAPGQPVEKRGHMLEFVDAAYAPYWYEGVIRQAVWRIKYDEREDAARAMARDMADCVRQTAAQPELILPIPSSKAELRRRGYSPPGLLARLLAEELGLVWRDEVLQKPFETRHQRGLGPAARRANLLGAFRVEAREAVRGKRVLLVDDVLTTGATLNECAKMLLAAGAGAVYAVCIAVTRTEEGEKER